VHGNDGQPAASSTDATSATVGRTTGPVALTAPTPATVGSAPVAPSLAATTATPAASAGAPPPPPTPAQQVVTVLAPLRSSEDGTHEVTIGLEPEGLGTVKATVTVSAGQVVVQLGTDNDQARDALRQALPLLKHELSGDGSSANVLLSNEGQERRPGFARQGTAPDAASGEDAGDGDGPSPVTTTGPVARHGHIDLHL